MTTYQIVCRKLTSQNTIDHVGLVEYGQQTKPAKFKRTSKQINNMIENNDQCFVTDKAGKEVEVKQFGDDFIRTKPDGIIKNNLLHLRECDFS